MKTSSRIADLNADRHFGGIYCSYVEVSQACCMLAGHLLNPEDRGSISL
jgi:hypothetical protein